MSAINQKSISGITSITTPTGVDDVFTLHSGDTTERFRVDQSGNQNISGIVTATNFKSGSSNLHSTGLTVGDTFVHSTGVNGSSADIDDFISVGNNIHLGNAGVITATTFKGDGDFVELDVDGHTNLDNVSIAGVVTATAYHGDGSDLTNLPAGLGTALSATASSPLNKMYYTNQVLGVPSSVTVDVPTSASKAYTQYADIKVESSADLIIAEGDDLIPDVLGLADFGTFGGGASAGRIRVNSITNAAANGATTIQNGVVISGMTTITGGLSIGGTITYEDVTNIDSIGIITARSGVDVDDFVSVGSNIHLGNAGVVTATTFSGSGASLTNIPSAQLTGALPAISGANLTGITIPGGGTNLDLLDSSGTGNGRIRLGASQDLQIYHDGSHSWTKNTTGRLILQTDGDQIQLRGNSIVAFNGAASTEYLRIDSAGRFLKGLTGSGASRSSTSVRYPHFQLSSPWTSGLGSLKIECTDDYPIIFIDSNASYANGSGAGVITWSVKDSSGDYCNTASVRSLIDDTPSNDSAPGRLEFMTTTSGTSPTTKMTISSEGYVTKPNHPSFCARHQSGSGFSGDIIVLTRISTSWDVWNTGGHYSTTTGKFTAPVAGVYYFEGQLMTTGHSNGDNIQDMFSLESNRGRITYVRQRESYFSTSTNANGYYTNSCGSSVRLAAGDTVWLQRHSNQNWGYSNRYYSYFTGWLIG